MRRAALLLTVVLLAQSHVPAHAAADTTYTIQARYQPGGEGGWDLLAVDPASHRLFLSRSTRVQVIDLDSGKLIGEIADTPGVHGIALAQDLGRGFTSNGRDSTVTVFDLKTLTTLKRVHLPSRNPDAILYEPVTKRVFTFNGGNDNATAIDAVTDSVVGEVALGGKPELPVSDAKGRVYVNLEDSSAVVSFDARTLKLGARWPLAPGEEPTGLAFDAKNRRLFSACGNQKMIVLNADNGKVVGVVPIGSRVDGAAFDPGESLAYSSNGEGTLTVIRAQSKDRYTVIATPQTQRGARTIALDPMTHRIYLPTASFGEAPAPTADNPRPRPPMVPDSFVILRVDH